MAYGRKIASFNSWEKSLNCDYYYYKIGNILNYPITCVLYAKQIQVIRSKKALDSQSINIIIFPFVNTPFPNLLFYSKTPSSWEIMPIAE